MSQKLAKGVRISGQERDDLAASLKERYASGESIRTIAADIGRSYGFVHGVLVDSDVKLRRRGGSVRKTDAQKK